MQLSNILSVAIVAVVELSVCEQKRDWSFTRSYKSLCVLFLNCWKSQQVTAKLDFTLDERKCLLCFPTTVWKVQHVGAYSGNVFSGISYERNRVMNCYRCCPIQFWVLLFILIPIVTCTFVLVSLKRHLFFNHVNCGAQSVNSHRWKQRMHVQWEKVFPN